MRKLFALFFLLPLSSAYGGGDESVQVNQCDYNRKIGNNVKTRERVFEINENQYLYVKQSTAIKKDLDKADLNISASCQSLTGTHYTGTTEEWNGYFGKVLKGLEQKGFVEADVTLHTGNNSVYTGYLTSREITVSAQRQDKSLLYRALAVLDLENNTLYTLSVSGEPSLKEKLEEEFKAQFNNMSIHTQEQKL
ncbi:hypothetical protein [Pseudoalteromonas pernae]|uniref:hypothetical protein n=1 Tax=Pseudoalteromonas pernae TaxID=3118054 RepID=UPI003242CC5A